jgi:glutamate N-acetyltransferase/amino-acid N-acetyltransferase
VVNSPLVKTMAYGADPNVGRLLMAIGKCFEVRIVPSRTHAWINGAPVIEGGTRAGFDDAAVRDLLRADVIDVTIELGTGDASATAFGCDLTEGYITENAAYYSS